MKHCGVSYSMNPGNWITCTKPLGHLGPHGDFKRTVSK